MPDKSVGTRAKPVASWDLNAWVHFGSTSGRRLYSDSSRSLRKVLTLVPTGSAASTPRAWRELRHGLNVCSAYLKNVLASTGLCNEWYRV